MAGAFKFNEVNSDDIPNQDHGPNGQKLEPLSIRQPFDIIAMEFDDSDFLLKNGYLSKGDPLAICGAAGIGKSRLILQLLIAIITGRDFLGWPTSGKGSRWLLLQTENVCRRLKSDLWAMFSILSAQEKQLVHDNLFIHTLETGDDCFLHLNIPENQERVAKLIDLYHPDGVVFDVLRDVSVDDLSADHGMQDTLAVISRLVRKKNPHCIPLIVHHARTGKAGHASATGFDRGSFGRNSKVLIGWVRAQINVAPYNPDDNEVLIIASAKCNNAPEFAPFAVRLDFKTMSYEPDDSIDIEEWKESLANGSSGKSKKKQVSADDVLALVPQLDKILKTTLINKAQNAGIGLNRTRGFIDELIDDKKLFEHRVKRSNARDLIHLARYAPMPDCSL